MGRMKEFIVQFVGLKDGSHEYEFGVNDAFFETFPESEIKKGSVKVTAELVKRPQMLTFDIHLAGEVTLSCDRCSQEYRQPVEGDFQLVVNLNGDTFNDEDDLISLPPGAHEFDLSQYLYEYLVLLLPSRRVCEQGIDSHCDPEILAKLNELQPGQHAPEENEDDDTDDTDPRWEGLKNIKF